MCQIYDVINSCGYVGSAASHGAGATFSGSDYGIYITVVVGDDGFSVCVSDNILHSHMFPARRWRGNVTPPPRSEGNPRWIPPRDFYCLIQIDMRFHIAIHI